MLDVCIVTIDDTRRPAGLEYAGERRLILDTRAPWAAAANAVLDQSENDVLFLDDDVELLPGSLDLVKTYYDQADLFGINLIAPNGPQGWYVQSAGHMLVAADQGFAWQPYNAFGTSVPCLSAHAGTSCMYIKRAAAQDKRVRFPEHWTGVHHEDIFFCLSAWLAGYKVARLPSTAIHYTHPIGAGLTRATQPDFHTGREENMRALATWMDEQNLADAIEDRRIPLGIWGMDGLPFELKGLGR